jgi:two-component system response regulator NreC
MKKLNILLAEDHNLVREGIRLLLQQDENINVVGGVTDGTEVMKMLGTVEIDIILTDINNTSQMSGISLIKAVKQRMPDIKMVILSMLDQEEVILRSFTEGASSYLLKNIDKDELMFALRKVSEGKRYLCGELSLKYFDRVIMRATIMDFPGRGRVAFSDRELEVLGLIAAGLTNCEISDKLFLSKRTVEGHRKSLIEKTRVRNTAMLIRYAISAGLI